MLFSRSCIMTNKKMPSLAELNDRIYELEPLNMPSAKDILSVSDEDAKAETLEYEKKYKALIDQSETKLLRRRLPL